jgi:DNA-binding Lrp family transcriptional regulator
MANTAKTSDTTTPDDLKSHLRQVGTAIALHWLLERDEVRRDIRDADVVAFERAALQLREVVYSHHVTGNYDYLLQVEVADLPAYEDFHANRLAALPGVAAVTSYVTMKTLSADTARPAGRRRLERPVN